MLLLPRGQKPRTLPKIWQLRPGWGSLARPWMKENMPEQAGARGQCLWKEFVKLHRSQALIGLERKPPVKGSWVYICVKHNREWIQPRVTALGKLSGLEASLISHEWSLIAHSRKLEAPLSSHLYLHPTLHLNFLACKPPIRRQQKLPAAN